MYVGACIDRDTDKCLVAERLPNGKRITNSVKPIYEFYIQDPDGDYEGIDGKRARKITCDNSLQFWQQKKKIQENPQKTYELYFNIINKCLYKYYQDSTFNKPHKSFYDIEVDLDSQPGITIDELIEKANCPINAVSVYNDWEDRLYTLMLCPDTLTREQAKEICNQFEDTYLCQDEAELLELLIRIVDDSDCITGYNSDKFDLPYIIRRMRNVLDESRPSDLCLWNKDPKEKVVSEFGKNHYEYDLIGKWSADYLLLYKKHERSKKESYKLDNIAYEELGERKVEYEGTLDDLYREDYKTFIEYNRQDTMLVYKLDKQLNYIDIHYAQAIDIGCLVNQTMGTVGWVDQAIINQAHNTKKIVPDKVEGKNPEFVGMIPPGAYVADPIPGLYNHIFSYDMNSLYPTTIRSVNMSPETIVGQLELTLTKPYIQEKVQKYDLYKHKGKGIIDWGKVWAGDDVWGTLEYQEVMKQSDVILSIKLESGESYPATAKQIYEMIFNPNSGLTLSAFGTIFKNDKEGLIPSVLSHWYAERKVFKKEMYRYNEMAHGVEIPEDMIELLK